jgi:hypothetical protein
MKRLSLMTLALLLAGGGLQAARYPVLGGPGLIHLQSAKTGQGFGLRSLNAFTSYSGQRFYVLDGEDNSFNDLWSHNLINYSPMENMGFMVVGLAHAEQWSIKSPGGDSLDNSLGCPGDFTLAAKYSLPLYDGKVDLGILPMITIPMDKDKFQDGPSQTGKVDFGGKLLTDIALDKATLLVNVGFLTRGDQRPQLPAGMGLEYSINPKFSAFLETSAELRLGSQKDSLPDSLVRSGRGYDRTEARITPGIRLVPLPLLGVNLAADIGLAKATAPWQIVLGLDFPAAAGLIRSIILPGTVAGFIRHRQTNQPVPGMITFPGTQLPAVTTGPEGGYQFKLEPGTYNIKVMANGFRTVDRRIEIKSGEQQSWDLTLSPKEGIIRGQVVDAANSRPVPAVITLNNNGDKQTADPATGSFSFSLPAPKKYEILAQAPGYQPYSASISLTDKQEAVHNIVLQAVPRPQPVAPAAAAPKPAKPAAAATPQPAAKPAPKAPGMTPEQIADLYKTGVKQYMSEEYDKAAATFKRLLAADPDNAKAKDYLKKSQERIKKIRG